MRNNLLLAFTAVAILAGGSLAKFDAMRAAAVHTSGIVCGGNGCAPAQTSAPQRRKFILMGRG
jgi:hypothetical protein